MAASWSFSNAAPSQAGEPTPKRTKILQTKSEIICTVCMDNISETSLSRPCRICQKPWCHACVRNLFVAATQDYERMPIRCCSELMHHGVGGGIISDQDLEAYKKRAEEMATPNPVYCPVVTCSAFIPRRLLLTDGTQMHVNCIECQATVCIQCRQLYDDHHECSKTPDLAVAKIHALGYKSCPQCGMGVMKKFGCDHIRCHCGRHWCWACARAWEVCERAPCPQVLEDGFEEVLPLESDFESSEFSEDESERQTTTPNDQLLGHSSAPFEAQRSSPLSASGQVSASSYFWMSVPETAYPEFGSGSSGAILSSPFEPHHLPPLDDLGYEQATTDTLAPLMMDGLGYKHNAAEDHATLEMLDGPVMASQFPSLSVTSSSEIGSTARILSTLNGHIRTLIASNLATLSPEIRASRTIPAVFPQALGTPGSVNLSPFHHHMAPTPPDIPPFQKGFTAQPRFADHIPPAPPRPEINDTNRELELELEATPDELPEPVSEDTVTPFPYVENIRQDTAIDRNVDTLPVPLTLTVNGATPSPHSENLSQETEVVENPDNPTSEWEDENSDIGVDPTENHVDVWGCPHRFKHFRRDQMHSDWLQDEKYLECQSCFEPVQPRKDKVVPDRGAGGVGKIGIVQGLVERNEPLELASIALQASSSPSSSDENIRPPIKRVKRRRTAWACKRCQVIYCADCRQMVRMASMTNSTSKGETRDPGDTEEIGEESGS